MAAKNKPAGAGAGFALTDEHRSLLSQIDTATKTGNVRFVSRAEAGDLVANGFININAENLDSNGNAAASLTDTGTKELPAVSEQTNTNTQEAAPAVTFKIATVAPPAIVRKSASSGNTGGRTAKYPLSDLTVGQAIFIPAPAGTDMKKLSKSFGSMVSGFNQTAAKAFAAGTGEDKYITSRGIVDGKEAGFGDEYAGVSGTGIYRVDVSQRPVRKPRAAKATAATGENAGGQAEGAQGGQENQNA